MKQYQNICFWTGIKSTDPFLKDRHDSYEWMEYSRNTWEYWCKKNGVIFIPYETPSNSDTKLHRPNWQRWIDMFDIIEQHNIKNPRILSTDASIMVKWDCPNLFDIGGDDFCALRSVENLKWVYESATGYAQVFPEVDFIFKDYFNSGFVMLNFNHKFILDELKDYYNRNQKLIVDLQEHRIKRGTDQPVLNYIVQKNNVPVTYLPLTYGINHLYRWEVLINNWQLNTNTMPHFINYFNVWIFSGFSDRGKTRNQLMSQTWNLVKGNYV